MSAIDWVVVTAVELDGKWVDLLVGERVAMTDNVMAATMALVLVAAMALMSAVQKVDVMAAEMDALWADRMAETMDGLRAVLMADMTDVSKAC